jgi:hypothetical protein
MVFHMVSRFPHFSLLLTWRQLNEMKMNYTHKYLNPQRQKLLRFMNSNVGLKHWQTSKHWYLLLIWGGKVLGSVFLPSCFNITHAFAYIYIYIYIYVSNNYFHCFCLIVHVYLLNFLISRGLMFFIALVYV